MGRCFSTNAGIHLESLPNASDFVISEAIHRPLRDVETEAYVSSVIMQIEWFLQSLPVQMLREGLIQVRWLRCQNLMHPNVGDVVGEHRLFRRRHHFPLPLLKRWIVRHRISM